MSSKTHIAIALLAYLTAHSACAADGPQPSLTWRLAFGAGTVQTGYGVALGYRATDLADAQLRIAELDVSDRAALARFAGMPLFQRDYRVTQNATAPEFRVALSKPWYAKSWVWWTAGGLAATAALAGGGGETTLCIDCNDNGAQSNQGTNVTGAGDEGIGCVNGDCAVECNPTNDPTGCTGFAGSRTEVFVTADLERQRWLDADTGHMGDLFAR